MIDGEIVVWRDGRLDFGALAPRLAYRGHRRPPEGLPPVSFLAFDVLAAGDVDVRTKPLRDRRAVLEQLAGSWRPPLQLTPQTAARMSWSAPGPGWVTQSSTSAGSTRRCCPLPSASTMRSHRRS